MSEGEATVEIDHATCIVSGMCASVASEVFRVADDNSAVIVLQPKVSGERANDARNAVMTCPVEAITVSD